jgi:hypothetical protein
VRIIEQNGDKLIFRIGVPYFNGTSCDFNRLTGRAVIKRVMLFWPMRSVDVGLAEIERAQLAQTSGSTGGTSYTKTYPVLLLKSGRPIAFAAASEKASKQTVEMINAFLTGLAPAG